MNPDPDHVQVLAVSMHAVECLPGVMPYDRYSRRRRDQHERRAHLLLNRLDNAGYTLTATSNNQEERP
jgi:hypothetical protein